MDSLRRPFFSRAVRSWRFLACLALIAMMGRALIPAGYMPTVDAQAGRLLLTLCSSSGSGALALFELSTQTEHPVDHAAAGVDCPFGFFASQPILTSPPVMPGLVGQRALVAVPALPSALPPLPPRGPPLGSRAPPVFLI